LLLPLLLPPLPRPPPLLPEPLRDREEPREALRPLLDPDRDDERDEAPADRRPANWPSSSRVCDRAEARPPLAAAEVRPDEPRPADPPPEDRVVPERPVLPFEDRPPLWLVFRPLFPLRAIAWSPGVWRVGGDTAPKSRDATL
jgi:hypothetical protein